MKIVKSLEESGLVIKIESKVKRGGLLSMLLGTLDESLLGNLLAGKCTIEAGKIVLEKGVAKVQLDRLIF